MSYFGLGRCCGLGVMLMGVLAAAAETQPQPPPFSLKAPPELKPGEVAPIHLVNETNSSLSLKVLSPMRAGAGLQLLFCQDPPCGDQEASWKDQVALTLPEGAVEVLEVKAKEEPKTKGRYSGYLVVYEVASKESPASNRRSLVRQEVLFKAKDLSLKSLVKQDKLVFEQCICPDWKWLPGCCQEAISFKVEQDAKLDVESPIALSSSRGAALQVQLDRGEKELALKLMNVRSPGKYTGAVGKEKDKLEIEANVAQHWLVPVLCLSIGTFVFMVLRWLGMRKTVKKFNERANELRSKYAESRRKFQEKLTTRAPSAAQYDITADLGYTIGQLSRVLKQEVRSSASIEPAKSQAVADLNSLETIIGDWGEFTEVLLGLSDSLAPRRLPRPKNIHLELPALNEAARELLKGRALTLLGFGETLKQAREASKQLRLWGELNKKAVELEAKCEALLEEGLTEDQKRALNIACENAAMAWYNLWTDLDFDQPIHMGAGSVRQILTTEENMICRVECHFAGTDGKLEKRIEVAKKRIEEVAEAGGGGGPPAKSALLEGGQPDPAGPRDEEGRDPASLWVDGVLALVTMVLTCVIHTKQIYGSTWGMNPMDYVTAVVTGFGAQGLGAAITVVVGGQSIATLRPILENVMSGLAKK